MSAPQVSKQLTASERLDRAIGKAYGCTMAECDVHSAGEVAVEIGLLSEDEWATEGGFAHVANLMGKPSGY